MRTDLKIKILVTLLALLAEPSFSEVCYPTPGIDDSEIYGSDLSRILNEPLPDSVPGGASPEFQTNYTVRSTIAPEEFLTNLRHNLYAGLEMTFAQAEGESLKKLGEDFEKITNSFKARVLQEFNATCHSNPGLCDHKDSDFELIWTEVSRNFRIGKRIELELQNHFRDSYLNSDRVDLIDNFSRLTAELKTRLHDEWWCSETDLCETGEFETFWASSFQTFKRKNLTSYIRKLLHTYHFKNPNFSLDDAKRLYRHMESNQDFQVFESDEDFETFFAREFMNYQLIQDLEREQTRENLITSLITLAKSTSHFPSASELRGPSSEQSSLDFLFAENLRNHEPEVQKRYAKESQAPNFDCRVFWSKPENIFGDGAEFRNNKWQRAKRETTRGQPMPFYSGPPILATTWHEIPKSELTEREDRVERLASLCEAVTLQKNIFKQFASLETEASLNILELFEARREVERFLHRMRTNEFRDDNQNLDIKAIDRHQGYKLALDVIFGESTFDSEWLLDENLKNQLHRVSLGGNNDRHILSNLDRILQRDHLLREVAEIEFETDETGSPRIFTPLEREKDNFLKMLSERKSRILKPEDITDEMLEQFYRSDSRLQQIFDLNQSIDLNEPHRSAVQLNVEAGPLHSLAEAKKYFFAELIEAKKQELQSIQSELSKINERRNFNPTSQSQSQLEPLLRKKRELLDHLKSLVSDEEFNDIKNKLAEMDFALQLAERISRPELSGKASPRPFDQRTKTWLPRILEDVGFRIDDPNVQAIIESLHVVYEFDESHLAIENIEKYFKGLIPNWNEMSQEEKTAVLQSAQTQAKSEYLKKTKETLYNIELITWLIQSERSQYHMNQALLLAALDERKKLLYRNLLKHFPEDDLNSQRRQIALEVSGYIRSLRQEGEPPPPGDVIKFAKETANSFRDAAVDLLDIGLSIAPVNTLTIPFLNWLTGDGERSFVDEQVLAGEDTQYLTNSLRSQGSRSWRADIDKKEVWQVAVFDLWLPAAFAAVAPVVSITMDPLFNLPTSFLDNVVYGQALGWNAEEIYKRRMAGDSSVSLGDNAAATLQAAIGFGMLLRGKTHIMERGRHFYRTGLKTPSLGGRLRPRSLIAGRTGNLTNGQAYALGATVVGGVSATTAYGISAASVAAEEWYAASREGRDINWGRVAAQTYQSGGLSMAYMGAIGVFTERVFKKSLQAAERLPAGRGRDLAIASVRQAQQRLAFKIDFIEGFMDAEHITDLFLEAESLDQYLAATLAASAVIYDSLGEQITSLSIRDGFYLIRGWGSNQALEHKIVLPPHLRTESEGSTNSNPEEAQKEREQYEHYRFERLNALFDRLGANIPRLSIETKSEVINATERARERLSRHQKYDYTPAPGESFDISKIYPDSIFSLEKQRLLQEYQNVGLSPKEAQSILDFVMSNHLIDDYQPPRPSSGQTIWRNMNRPVF